MNTPILSAPGNDHLPQSACFKIARRSLAFGGKWLTANEGAHLRDRAAQEAYLDGADYAAFYEAANQYGLFSLDQRDKTHPGSGSGAWHSAAALLTAALPHPSWMGAWELPDGRWWTVIVNGLCLLPEGDMIHDSEDKAKTFLMEYLGKGTSWRCVYAPSGWVGIPDSDGTSLADVLAKAPSSWSLFRWPPGFPYALTLAKSRRSSLGGMALTGTCVSIGLAIAVYGVQYFMTWTSAPPPPPTAPGPIQGPAPHYIPGRTSLLSCLTAAYYNWPQKVLAPGWTPVGFSCNGKALVMATVAQPDTPVHLTHTVNPALVIDKADNRKATLSIPLTDDAPPVDTLPHSTEDELRRFFEMYAETITRTNGDIKWHGERMPPASPPAHQTAAAPKVIPHFSVVKWQLITLVPPNVWGPVLSRLPDWALINLADDETGGTITWTVEGVSHVIP